MEAVGNDPALMYQAFATDVQVDPQIQWEDEAPPFSSKPPRPDRLHDGLHSCEMIDCSKSLVGSFGHQSSSLLQNPPSGYTGTRTGRLLTEERVGI